LVRSFGASRRHHFLRSASSLFGVAVNSHVLFAQDLPLKPLASASWRRSNGIDTSLAMM
jgi:hypothetical protein